jgi:hypothetical protein
MEINREYPAKTVDTTVTKNSATLIYILDSSCSGF